jgi:hypothetical protein
MPIRGLVHDHASDRLGGVAGGEDGNGVLRDGRRYQLVRRHKAVCERTVEITFLEPGASAHEFTLG